LLSRSSLVAGALVLALISLPVAADQTGELEQLRQEAAALRQSLDRLDGRIHTLESQSQDPAPGKSVEPPAPVAVPAPAAAPAPVATPAPAAAAAAVAASASIQPIVSLRQNWSQVERGMPREKVQSLLGPPEKVLQIDGSTVWYYAYPGIGRGSVFFNGDGKVSGEQSPTFGWGW
jgi:hypothetical protein